MSDLIENTEKSHAYLTILKIILIFNGWKNIFHEEPLLQREIVFKAVIKALLTTNVIGFEQKIKSKHSELKTDLTNADRVETIG